MIQVYADGVLAYDSMLEKYDLLGLTVIISIPSENSRKAAESI